MERPMIVAMLQCGMVGVKKMDTALLLLSTWDRCYRFGPCKVENRKTACARTGLSIDEKLRIGSIINILPHLQIERHFFKGIVALS
jgi:hypothetical protein